MPSGASTRRYAQAVFQLAVEHDNARTVAGGPHRQLADSITNEEFSRTLSAPRISMEQKEGIIRESLGSSVDRLALNLMFLLTSRNLVHLLPDIADSFQEMLDAHQGIERAEVVSAVPLSDTQQGRSLRDARADVWEAGQSHNENRPTDHRRHGDKGGRSGHGWQRQRQIAGDAQRAS